jgi:hypothetical protein
MLTRRAIVLSLVCLPVLSGFRGRTWNRQPEKRPGDTLTLEIVSVKPTGLRDHGKQWIVTGVVVNPRDGGTTRHVRLFLHSPVLTFHLDAKELVKARAKIKVVSAVNDDIYQFAVISVSQP